MLSTKAEVKGERLLLNSVKSPYSQEGYRRNLRKYLKTHGYDSADELLSKGRKEIENEVVNFIITCKEKGMRHAAILNYVKPVISLCKINDIPINSTKVKKFMPPNVRAKKTGVYSDEQIAKLLQVADERMSVIILLCSSAGLRIGSLPLLQWSNLKSVGDIYEITVYEGEPEEYVTFCSTEAKRAIQTYLSVRKMHGEVITGESPLIREQFDRRDPFASAHPRRVRKDYLGDKVAELARIAGLRTKTTLEEDEKHKGATKLQDIPQCNGLRRFFCSTLMNSGLQTEIRWLLEGHNLKGNDNSYLKVSSTDLYKSYMLAHDNLLIDQSHKLRRQVEKLEVEKSQFERLAAKIAAIEQKIK
jgi:integrase